MGSNWRMRDRFLAARAASAVTAWDSSRSGTFTAGIAVRPVVRGLAELGLAASSLVPASSVEVLLERVAALGGAELRVAA
jgi:hypothetical protein